MRRCVKDESLCLLFLFVTQINYLLPGESFSPEVSAVSSLLVNGFLKVEVFDDSVGSQVEVAHNDVP